MARFPRLNLADVITMRVYLGLSALGTAAYFMVGAPANNIFYTLVGALTVVAVLVGMHRHAQGRMLAWYLLAFGQLLFVVADIGFEVVGMAAAAQGLAEPPSPSLADLFYLLGYPMLAAGLLLMSRRRDAVRDLAGLLDVLMIVTAVTLIVFETLIGPALRDESVRWVKRLVDAAYPAGDLLLLAAVARLLVGPGVRASAFRLLAASIILLLGADVFSALRGYEEYSAVLDLVWLASYMLFGAAALHPSMTSLTTPASTRVTLSRVRMLLLGVALAVPPMIVVVEARTGHPVGVAVVAVGALTMTVLVLVRITGLVRGMERAIGDYERVVERETNLRRVGFALVKAADRDQIFDAGLQGVSELFETFPERISIATGFSHLLLVSAATGMSSEYAVGNSVPVESLDLETIAALEAGQEILLENHAPLDIGGDHHNDSKCVYLIPLLLGDQLRGLIIVTNQTTMAADAISAVRALASELSLALERASLTEDLHRRQSEQRFRSLVQNASDVITVIDGGGDILYQSPSVEPVLGYSASELEGSELRSLVHPEDRLRLLATVQAEIDHHGGGRTMTVRMLHRDGAWRQCEMLVNNLLDDMSVSGIVLTIRDVTDRLALEEQLRHQAFHDALTGLANRALLVDRIEHAVTRAENGEASIALLCIDLDDFRTVNDSIDHAAGDHVLVTVAERLRSTSRRTDTVARLGGDEFAVLLEETPGEEGAKSVASEIMEILRQPVDVNGQEVFISASVGIAVGAPSDENGDGVVRNAELAMYLAKRKGKNRYECYEPSMLTGAVERFELTADLQKALENDEFALYYQPIMSLETNGVAGVEALIRWEHPKRGLVSPADFIPLTEETGLIVPIGRWVLMEACRQAKQWHDELPDTPPVYVSVNVSVRQLEDPKLVSDIATALSESGLDPRFLTVEITESVLMEDAAESAARMSEIKKLGVTLAIDDFGTGYSSLRYLSQFAVDTIKIDQAFVRPMGKAGDEAVLVRGILELARSLRMRAVAEGIEDETQLQELKSLGCPYGQGYFFSRPVPAVAMGELLRSDAADEPVRSL